MTAIRPVLTNTEDTVARVFDSRGLTAESGRHVLNDRALIAVTQGLIATSRDLIAESRFLLAEIEHPIAPTPPSQTRTSQAQSAAYPKAQGNFSISVSQKGLAFEWTFKSPANDVLGRGLAETEHKARIDAFRAGMTYIDRSKDPSRSDPTRH